MRKPLVCIDSSEIIIPNICTCSKPASSTNKNSENSTIIGKTELGSPSVLQNREPFNWIFIVGGVFLFGVLCGVFVMCVFSNRRIQQTRRPYISVNRSLIRSSSPVGHNRTVRIGNIINHNLVYYNLHRFYICSWHCNTRLPRITPKFFFTYYAQIFWNCLPPVESLFSYFIIAYKNKRSFCHFNA